MTNSCANCGAAEVEGAGVKLKTCTGCKSVKYCGVKCHKRACKKRAAELKDELLFKQPESSHFGDCPICFLPISLVQTESHLMVCCSKLLCTGCCYFNDKREREEGQVRKCPFCRQPSPESEAKATEIFMERGAEKKCPVATCKVGNWHFKQGQYSEAIHWYSVAAELDDAESNQILGRMYLEGMGVEKDESKAMYFWEKSAIAGHPHARYNLGCSEWNNGRRQRAIKHWLVSTKLGDNESLETLKLAFQDGLVSKDDLASALRGHQAAVDATKSRQREEAEEYVWKKYL